MSRDDDTLTICLDTANPAFSTRAGIQTPSRRAQLPSISVAPRSLLLTKRPAPPSAVSQTLPVAPPSNLPDDDENVFMDGMSILEFDEKFSEEIDTVDTVSRSNQMYFSKTDQGSVGRAAHLAGNLHTQLAEVYRKLSAVIKKTTAIAQEKRRIFSLRSIFSQPEFRVRNSDGKIFSLKARSDVYHRTKLEISDVFKLLTVLERPIEVQKLVETASSLAELESSSEVLSCFARLVVSMGLGVSRQKLFLTATPAVLLEDDASSPVGETLLVDDKISASLEKIYSESGDLATDAREYRAIASEIYSRLTGAHSVLDKFEETTGIRTIFTDSFILQRRSSVEPEQSTERLLANEVMDLVCLAFASEYAILYGKDSPAKPELLTSREFVQRLRNRISQNFGASLQRTEPKRKWCLSVNHD
jgi:hypothetical protein